MKILVTVKRVVDPDVKVKLNRDGELDMTNVEYKLNPFDEYGIEEAVRLKERKIANDVVVVTVGTKKSVKELRSGLAMGANRAILIQVDKDETLDPLTVAKLLAAIVEKEEPDLVLLGKLAVDGENNQVGQMLAELTDMPQATFAHNIEIEDGELVVGREVDGGTMDVRVSLPALVTADLRLNEPRYTALPGIMRAKRIKPTIYTPDELGVELEPQVRILGYELPNERAAGQIVESVEELVEKLADEAKVI